MKALDLTGLGARQAAVARRRSANSWDGNVA